MNIETDVHGPTQMSATLMNLVKVICFFNVKCFKKAYPSRDWSNPPRTHFASKCALQNHCLKNDYVGDNRHESLSITQRTADVSIEFDLDVE